MACPETGVVSFVLSFMLLAGRIRNLRYDTDARRGPAHTMRAPRWPRKCLIPFPAAGSREGGSGAMRRPVPGRPNERPNCHPEGVVD